MSPLFQKREFRIAAGIVLGVALVLLALIVVLTRGKELDARHRPLDFAETFDFDTGTFADYAAYSARRLRAARADAPDAVIANLAPFRMEPAPEQNCPASTTAMYRNGIVLTHDLLDSPYGMHALGQYFQQRCFLVYGPLLPGHGTRPGDLLRTGWQEWVAAERFATRELSKEVDNLYLGGHGAGGTLAILEASTNASVDGLVLFAPALNTRMSWQAMAGSALDWLTPAGMHWAKVVPVYSAYRYESWPYRLVRETNALVQAMEAALPTRPLEVPVFTVATLEDAVVSTPAILAYMADRVHPLSQTLIYGRQAVNEGPPGQFVNSYYPAEGLLSLTHSGLILPIQDREFGWSGTGKDCGHYYRADRDAYGHCMAGERKVLGEVTPEHLAAGLLERIGFNPFYYDMARTLDNFVAPIAPIPDTTPR